MSLRNYIRTHPPLQPHITRLREVTYPLREYAKADGIVATWNNLRNQYSAPIDEEVKNKPRIRVTRNGNGFTFIQLWMDRGDGGRRSNDVTESSHVRPHSLARVWAVRLLFNFSKNQFCSSFACHTITFPFYGHRDEGTSNPWPLPITF